MKAELFKISQSWVLLVLWRIPKGTLGLCILGRPQRVLGKVLEIWRDVYRFAIVSFLSRARINCCFFVKDGVHLF